MCACLSTTCARLYTMCVGCRLLQQVFKVWVNSKKSVEAISAMDVEMISSSGNEAVIEQEVPHVHEHMHNIC